MTTATRTLIFSVLSFVFSAFAPVFADSNKHHSHHNHSSKQYFLAPDITTSEISVNGVDLTSGKVNLSNVDLSLLTLGFSRVYSGTEFATASLGGWNHEYMSELALNGLSYSNWQGIKSGLYKGKSKACKSGWNDIKGSVFNGQLSNARAKYRRGLCQISMSHKTVAEFIVHSTKKPSNAVILSRPDGSTMSFVKSGLHYKTLSGVPFELTRSGKNWKVFTPSGTTEVYNKNGKLIKKINSNSQVTLLQYGGGKLSKITGSFGKTLQLSYQNGRLDKVVGPSGTVSYDYVDGQLSQVTKIDGSTMGYSYDSNGLITSITDTLGEITANYKYDEHGGVVLYKGQDGSRETSYVYNGDQTIVTNVANNASDTYSFDVILGIPKQTRMTNVAGNNLSQSYDKNGYPKESTAINGTKTRTIYNDKGLLLKRIESVGLESEKTTITEWHNEFRKPILQVEDGFEVGNKATQSIYNNKGLLVKRIDGLIKKVSYPHHGSKHSNSHRKKGRHDGHGHYSHKPTITLKDKRITRYRYNNKGQVVKTIAPNGVETLTSYDAQGNRTGSSNALGHENKILLFDAASNALKLEDANGVVTESTYDIAGRLLTKTTNSRTTKYEYDARGRQTKITYPDGSSTSNEYDALGNITKTIDQDGNVNVISFDNNGNQIGLQIIDNMGNVISNSSSEYNNQNQLVKNIDAQGNATFYEYDSQGNQVIVTDANGNNTQSQYDESNRLVKMIDALGGETVYTYNADGNRTSIVAPNGSKTVFVYNSFDQLRAEISSDKGITTYQYDISGNLIKTVDANGNQKNISYDILSRKTGVNWTGAPDLTIAYTYDNCDNGVGKLCRITDKSGSTSFQYDTKGQVTQKTQNIEGVELTKTYAYNNEGQLIREIYPSGTVISYNYNADEVQSISIDGNPYITDISYNAANQLTGWNWADGTPYTKTYDANSRLASFPLGNEIRTLAYDANGNITGWTDSGKTEAKTFSYDALNRLTNYNKAEAGITLEDQLFSYDGNGNRIQLEENSVQTIYSILAETNRLSQVGTTEYQYDANGNITDDGEHNYSYDARNRMTGVDGTNTYLFNAKNMRVKKTTPIGTILYGWDNDRIFAEYDDKGDVIQETVYLDSMPIALLKDGEINRIYTDQVNTPRVVTNSSNITLWSWNSKPFGESTPVEDVDGDGTNLSYNLRFPGQYYDEETGKHYNFNREYNPSIGRYTQSDPAGIEGGMNSYEYAISNPVSTTDPLGLWPTKAYGKWIDISIDFHNSPHASLDTFDKLNIALNSYSNINFTVYLYARDAAQYIPYLKGRGVAVGLHLDNSTTNAEIDTFYTALGNRQPLNRTSASIHGAGTTRLSGAHMAKLDTYQVEFVRTASSIAVAGDGPKIKRVIDQTTPAANIRGHSLLHYFTHSHQHLRLPDLNSNQL